MYNREKEDSWGRISKSFQGQVPAIWLGFIWRLNKSFQLFLVIHTSRKSRSEGGSNCSVGGKEISGWDMVEFPEKATK